MTRLRSLLPAVIAGFLLTVSATVANAHTTGENYAFVSVDADALRVRLEIHENDLESHFGLTTGESLPEPADIARVVAYAMQHFEVRQDGVPLDLVYREARLLELPQGVFLELHFTAQWPAALPEKLTVRQALFLDENPQHRGLLLLEYNAVADRDYGPEYTALVFGPDNEVQELDLVDVPGLLRMRQILWQGVWHILIGFDHILFLLTLLFTSVVARKNETWVAEQSFRKALINVAAIVTVFTVAHSVSLSLAALGIVKLPSRPVEIVIALSIIVMAIHNLRAFLPARWVVIFVFGLFHGLGFATVMGHLAFRMVDLVKVLVLFNVGVEVGQLAIVAIAFPLLYLFRRRSWFVPAVVRGGSTLVAVIAAYWLIERLFF